MNTRNWVICLVALVAFLDFGTCHAQINNTGSSPRQVRRERAHWRRTARQYVRNPLALRAREEATQQQLEQLIEKNNEFTDAYNQQVSALYATRDSLRAAQANAANTRTQPCPDPVPVAAPTPAALTGVVFRVQMGAYERMDLSRYDLADENFQVVQNGQVKCYQIGNFRKYRNAQAFRDDLKRMGIRDAFIVAFRDGQRIEVQEAIRLENRR